MSSLTITCFFPSRLEWNPCDVGTLMGSKKKQLRNVLIDKKREKKKSRSRREKKTLDATRCRACHPAHYLWE